MVACGRLKVADLHSCILHGSTCDDGLGVLLVDPAQHRTHALKSLSCGHRLCTKRCFVRTFLRPPPAAAFGMSAHDGQRAAGAPGAAAGRSRPQRVML